VGADVRPARGIGGQLNLNGATLRNAGGVALGLDGAEITGGLIANEGFIADGEVRAVGVHIGGRLGLIGATLRNADGTALKLDSAQIAEGVFADGFKADGKVRAAGAHIGVQLNLNGATLRNAGGDALDLDTADITHGGIFAGGGFQADGRVSAVGAHIGGGLSFEGATLRNTGGDALFLESAVMDKLILRRADLRGLSLYRAVIGDLVTGEDPPTPLVATGLEVADIHGPLRTDCGAARRWLNTNPEKVTSVQPWHALAAVYERNGDPAGARRLRFAAANKVTRQSPWPSKILRLCYGVLVGHGYYPLLAMGWLIAVVAAGWFIVANTREDIVPTKPTEAVAAVDAHAAATKTTPPSRPITAETPCGLLHPEYPCLNSFTFALNSLVPPAATSANADWAIQSDGTRWLTVTLPLKLVAWGLAALLLAGVTGLLRKT
jgi:hypothetical protein